MADWQRVIDQAAQAGVAMVQFIGGEPTLHSGLPYLLAQAVNRGMEVEVFSNLVHVSPELWGSFSLPGVRLACSYYSDDPVEHAAVTKRAGSHARTLANIKEALRRKIPLRAGVIDMGDGQRSRQAATQLAELGVPEVGTDHIRQVGRGVRDSAPNTDQLCGHCGNGVVAISPHGVVWPCVFSRWMPVGNVHSERLDHIVNGPLMAAARATLARGSTSGKSSPCLPTMCDPQCGPSCSPACNPQCWPTGTGPCTPRGGCIPNYDPDPAQPFMRVS